MFINLKSINNNYGTPCSIGEVFLPDEMLEEYIQAKGFVIPTIKNNIVTKLTVNKSALDAYNASIPPEEISEEEALSLIAEELNIDAENCMAEIMEVFNNA